MEISKINYCTSKPIKVYFPKIWKKTEHFWELIKVFAPELPKIDLKLLKIPASSAQLERIFSMCAMWHGKLRNRLSFQHSMKLMHIYYSFAMNDEHFLDDDDYHDEDI